jgi:hypothetical protein
MYVFSFGIWLNCLILLVLGFLECETFSDWTVFLHAFTRAILLYYTRGHWLTAPADWTLLSRSPCSGSLLGARKGHVRRQQIYRGPVVFVDS